MSHVLLENAQKRVNNIFCIGRNYAAHIEELKNEMPSETVLFTKPNSAILRSGGEIRLPAFGGDVHFETELVLLVGKDSDGLAEGESWQTLIAGYGVGLDLTARDVQGRLKEKGLPWLKAKGFRGSACVSDFVAADKLPNPDNCTFTLHIDGGLRQKGETVLMIHPPAELVGELAAVFGLREGDLIFTGTPEGVGKLSSGSRLQLDLAGLVKAEFTVV
ncbi:fumarylacetoacetate hydrolase family protein [Neisseria chenwenguii]|uniref:Isomerase/hydrolase n=1 Tax=Neisseria chenwenguii TaxID=1853278 RepID=A0A220RZ62_9NEIS|nr:fumarylacetoacetate hydrolase family protein [Neisseria chenwenguii]ASK26467.1 isomerase/hydrolase [Neisseria chenwenguii]ROV55909.1 FAA hydrolase family protein [Neisseria chenwenguii]